MVSNLSSVPRRMLRNSGMSPMPSGRSRQTSSVIPGRMVGLTMPTTPRQLVKDMRTLAVAVRPGEFTKVIRGTHVMELGAAAGSLGLDVGRADYLRPLF